MSINTPRQSLLARYLESFNGITPSSAAIAFYASLDHIASVSPTVATTILKELRDQRSNLKLIASENYSSLVTQLASGNLFSDKYAERAIRSGFA